MQIIYFNQFLNAINGLIINIFFYFIFFSHHRLPFAVQVAQYSRIKAIGGLNDVINQGRLLPVDLLHGFAAAVVLDPLQHQAHDVDAAAVTSSQEAD